MSITGLTPGEYKVFVIKEEDKLLTPATLIMRFQIPVSGKEFKALDVSEAVIVFPCPRILNSDLDIEVWGVTLLTATRFWLSSLPVPLVSFDASKENIYIAAYSNLHLHGVVAGKLTVRLYEPERSPIVFTKLYDGGYVVLNRSWRPSSENDSTAARSYEMHSVLAWPFGECDFILRAHGSISLEFDPAACVSSRIYSSTPERFRWNRHLIQDNAEDADIELHSLETSDGPVNY